MAGNHIDLGSDHRCIRLQSTVTSKQVNTKRWHRKPQQQQSKPTWPPPNSDTYRNHLTTQLSDIDITADVSHGCSQIESAIKAALPDKPHTTTHTTSNDDLKALLRRSLEERNSITEHSDRARRQELNKQVRKEIRAIRRAERCSCIDRIIEDFRGLKKIAGIKSTRAKTLIPSMNSSDGRTVRDRKGIADIFADFYESLYAQKEADIQHDMTGKQNTTDATSDIPPFTPDELAKAMTQLRNGKASDKAGIIAEMLKGGGDKLHDALLNLYNEVIKRDATTPEQWKRAHIMVIYKSGDPQQPSNYRPITVIPLLYKLFARMIYNRLEPLLDPQQPPEQAGFRRQYSTEDHLFTLVMTQEKANEWRIPLWTATLDFRKAFDTVTHSALWTALEAQHIPKAYIALLAKLYSNQTATVRTDQTSREFSIRRGTKQGDPLSSLLFNSLSEHIFRQLVPTWRRLGYGVCLDSATNHLTDLRFADDVILFATSLRQIKSMLTGVHTEAAKTGLELHPDKTKIMHNQQHRKPRNHPEYTPIAELQVEILPHASSQKYLGRKFTFDNPHETELNNRIAAGWRKFHMFKRELTTRSYSLRGRLRLFHGVVTPTVLYSCTAWTLTTQIQNKLKRTQRQMLRMIIGSPRRRCPTAQQEQQQEQQQQPQQQQQQQPHRQQVHDMSHTQHQPQQVPNESKTDTPTNIHPT